MDAIERGDHARIWFSKKATGREMHQWRRIEKFLRTMTDYILELKIFEAVTNTWNAVNAVIT
jgi:hypothetical protein